MDEPPPEVFLDGKLLIEHFDYYLDGDILRSAYELSLGAQITVIWNRRRTHYYGLSKLEEYPPGMVPTDAHDYLLIRKIYAPLVKPRLTFWRRVIDWFSWN